jgi:hypothetical protein
VSAPGIGIYTTSRGGGYSNVSGTSFSSPIVAGVAALVVSVNSALTPEEIMDLLAGTAVDLGPAGYDTSFGYGRVDAYAAVTAAGGLEPQPDTTPPSVVISAPTDGSTVSATVNVSVDAPDDVGTVQVELYLDDALLATDTNAPFVFAWDSQTTFDGSHSLQAVALDAAGNRGFSETAAVVVDNTIADTTPPEVTIVSPAEGEFVAGDISVSVSTSDDIGVTAVELYLDGGFLSVDNTAPFSFTWDTTLAADGTHTLQARAYDAAGNVASSAEINVIVQTAVSDTTAPQVAITFPADGSTVSKLVKIQVQASDDRQMQQVQLFVDGSLFRSATCEAESCSLRFNWNTRKVAKGWHTLSAIAHDAAGNMGTSSAVNVDVK